MELVLVETEVLVDRLVEVELVEIDVEVLVEVDKLVDVLWLVLVELVDVLNEVKEEVLLVEKDVLVD